MREDSTPRPRVNTSPRLDLAKRARRELVEVAGGVGRSMLLGSLCGWVGVGYSALAWHAFGAFVGLFLAIPASLALLLALCGVLEWTDREAQR